MDMQTSKTLNASIMQWHGELMPLLASIGLLIQRDTHSEESANIVATLTLVHDRLLHVLESMDACDTVANAAASHAQPENAQASAGACSPHDELTITSAIYRLEFIYQHGVDIINAGNDIDEVAKSASAIKDTAAMAVAQLLALRNKMYPGAIETMSAERWAKWLHEMG